MSSSAVGRVHPVYNTCESMRRAHQHCWKYRFPQYAHAGAADSFHPSPHICRRFPQAHVAQFLIFHTRYLHMHVDPIHQRSGDALLVARDLGRGTSAESCQVPERPTGVDLLFSFKTRLATRSIC